jgi:FtsP/CotA-like multicopper oxidase with cupredoxin domain
MNRQKLVIFAVLIMGSLCLNSGLGHGQSNAAKKNKSGHPATPAPSATCAAGQMRCVTEADRIDAAKRAAALRSAQPVASPSGATPLAAVAQKRGAKPMAATPLLSGCPTPVMNPNGMPDYMSGCVGNYANSPLPITSAPATAGGYPTYVSGGLRKFIDPLPSIPVAAPDITTYPGSDYYEISLVEYSQQMHSDLPNKTLLRGYVQTNYGTDANGNKTIAPASVQYLGPIIVAHKDRPVRVKFTNKLPLTGAPDAFGQDGNLFIPVDTTVMGSGMAPDGTSFSQNRSGIHLHGGNTPWISDGTPHQWTTPAGENTNYPKGVSVRDVPDMPPSASGEMTFFYTNQQSARLMFYHDHAYGITRLNVYAGVAAGYLLEDPVELTMINGGVITPPAGAPVTVPSGTIPAAELPLIIQDKTFIPPPDQLTSQDPTWNWGPKDASLNYLVGDLWFPHVYMPNQNPTDLAGVNPMGRWDWGPWFWPPMDPSTLKQGEVPCPPPFNLTQTCPGTPNPSLVPEAFMDTPVVNGAAYPYVQVDPKPYRLRILNASNDRSLNLSLYQAFDQTGLLPTQGNNTFAPDPNAVTPVCTTPTATPPAGQPQTCTEVRFVTPTDGIAGQGPVPDPTTVGPNMIQIGAEGGMLPAPVTLTNTPIGYNYNRRDIVVLNVQSKNLFLGPAERADLIVDFSQFAGKTLILYNDAPAPVPAFDTRYDYFTGDQDQTLTGGAPTTLPGYGPNTRTVMQIRVGGTTSGTAYDPTALNAALPAAFAASQDAPLVPESAYGPAYATTYPNTYSRIQDTSLFAGSLTGITITSGGSGYSATPAVTITGGGGTGASATATVTAGVITAITLGSGGTGYTSTPTVTITDTAGTGAAAAAVGVPILRKAIQELFELDYGRMNATLGVELPFTSFATQTTIPLGYIDPPTENFKDGETQVWKITHNGVDTHAIHFHLFNVQVINRVGWDGAIRPPDPNELGWKETVRMNPLEDAIVAIRPVKQNLPWTLPDSVRLQDVTAKQGDQIRVVDSINGNPGPVTNEYINFASEYVWHCHLLGHEENDMMRPMIFQVPPEAPSGLTAGVVTGTSNVALGWKDNSQTETSFIVQRDIDPGFSNPTALPAAASSSLNVIGQGVDSGSVLSITDTTAGSITCPTSPCTLFYRVQAVNNQAFNGYVAAGAGSVMQTQTLTSPWSNIATTGPTASVSVAPLALPFGNVLVGTSLAGQPIVITNNGQGPLMIGSVAFSGLNPTDFVQTNTCSGTILNLGTCSITVTFTPAAMGARAGTLTFTTSDPANPAITIALTGNGISPLITVSPAPLAFANQPVSTTSAAQIVTIANTGGTAPLTINSIGISGVNAADFQMTQNCATTFPVTMAIGASCAASITFTPAAAGARAATIAVTAAAPASTQTVAISGTGTTPGASLAPLSLTFPSQFVLTSSAAQTVMLTNTGLAPLSISSIAVTGTNAADFNATGCGTTLAAGANCLISVTFTPQARGMRTATLVVTDSASTPTQTATLNGTGVAPMAAIYPPVVPFGVQLIATTSVAQTLVISNSGDVPLVLGTISISGANASDFAFSPGTCIVPVPALQVCMITVSFTPTAAGARAGVLSVASNDPINPLLSVPLTGTGTAVALSPSAITFPNQTVGTSSTSWTITIGNSGPAALTINSIVLSDANPADFTLNNQCGAAINSGRSCTVRVRFAPTAIGVRTASLVVSTSDLGTPQASVALTGTGTAPALSATPTTLTFSSALNTASAPQVVTVSNLGTSPLTITSINLGGTNTGQFTQTNNCRFGTPIAAGASCTVNVTFRPTSANPTTMSQTLNINAAAPAVSQSIPLTGNVVVPTFTVSPATVAFPNQAINTTSAAQTVTVTNTGTVPLPITNVNITGANARRFAQTNTCGAGGFRPFPNNLAVGASCTVNVTFQPTTATANTASLNISVGGGAAPAQTQVSLTGTGQ